MYPVRNLRNMKVNFYHTFNEAVTDLTSVDFELRIEMDVKINFQGIILGIIQEYSWLY